MLLYNLSVQTISASVKRNIKQAFKILIAVQIKLTILLIHV